MEANQVTTLYQILGTFFFLLSFSSKSTLEFHIVVKKIHGLKSRPDTYNPGLETLSNTGVDMPQECAGMQ